MAHLHQLKVEVVGRRPGVEVRHLEEGAGEDPPGSLEVTGDYSYGHKVRSGRELRRFRDIQETVISRVLKRSEVTKPSEPSEYPWLKRYSDEALDYRAAHFATSLLGAEGDVSFATIAL